MSVMEMRNTHFVDGDGIKFETNQKHFSRQELLVICYIVGTMYNQIFVQLFSSKVGLQL